VRIISVLADEKVTERIDDRENHMLIVLEVEELADAALEAVRVKNTV